MDFGSTKVATSSVFASGIKGNRKFATGVAASNAKSPEFNQYAKERMQETAVALFKEQTEIANLFLGNKSGDLIDHLRSAPFNVSSSGGTVHLELNYILKVRFIDLRKTALNRPKENYVQIYNRLVWGYIFGNLYPQLKYGFTNLVRQRYVDQLKETYKRII